MTRTHTIFSNSLYIYTHTESTSMSPSTNGVMVLQQHNDQPIAVVSIFSLKFGMNRMKPVHMFMRQGAYEVTIPVSTETHGGIFVTADRC